MIDEKVDRLSKKVFDGVAGTCKVNFGGVTENCRRSGKLKRIGGRGEMTTNQPTYYDHPPKFCEVCGAPMILCTRIARYDSETGEAVYQTFAKCGSFGESHGVVVGMPHTGQGEKRAWWNWWNW